MSSTKVSNITRLQRLTRRKTDLYDHIFDAEDDLEQLILRHEQKTRQLEHLKIKLDDIAAQTEAEDAQVDYHSDRVGWEDFAINLNTILQLHQSELIQDIWLAEMEQLPDLIEQIRRAELEITRAEDSYRQFCDLVYPHEWEIESLLS